jgi:GGDEF domain-containing protein
MKTAYSATEREATEHESSFFLSLVRRDEMCGIPAPMDFRLRVQRERTRADRHSLGFSIVSFDVARNGDDLSRTSALVKVLKKRCRVTDEIGWLNEEKVGVILPDTNAEGAQVFADDVRCALANPGPPSSCRVHVYPTHRTRAPGKDGGIGERPPISGVVFIRSDGFR